MIGTLNIVGVGPGDPDLITLKAARLIAAAGVIAYFAKRGQPGHGRQIAAAHVSPAAEEWRFEYPFTTELNVKDDLYTTGMTEFYADCADRIADHLAAGQDVTVVCEGDPFFYGSSLALLDRLGHRYPSVVVPGVTGMSGCWTQAALPLVRGDDVLTVLPATLDQSSLGAHLATGAATVIMKLGRNLPKIQLVLRQTDRLDQAVYVERGTMAEERVLPLAELDVPTAPYFALILVPARRRSR